MRVALSHITSQECVCVCARAQTSCIKTEINENKRTAHPSKDWKTNNNLIINLVHKSFFGQRAAANALFISGSADLNDWEFSPKRDICVKSPQTQAQELSQKGTVRITWAAGWKGTLRSAAFRIWHGHRTHSNCGYLQSNPQYGWERLRKLTKPRPSGGVNSNSKLLEAEQWFLSGSCVAPESGPSPCTQWQH